MKAKLNLNGAAIKEFFVNNGEKLILAVTVLILVSFLYGAITAQPIDSQKPDEIKTASQDVQTRVNAVEWDEYIKGKPEFKAPDYSKLTQKNFTQEIAVAKLDQDREWSPPIFEELVKRPDPEIFTVAELQGVGGNGIMPFEPDPQEMLEKQKAAAAEATKRAKELREQEKKERERAERNRRQPGGEFGGRRGRYGLDEESAMSEREERRTVGGASLPGARATNADPEPVSYAVVTGLVELEKQYDEYKRRFEFAMEDPAVTMQTGRYMPSYRYFNVERAKVRDSRDKELKWKALEHAAVLVDTVKWVGQPQQEMADPNYVFQPMPTNNPRYQIALTWPLPPLYLKDWGLEAIHPKVPLYELTEQYMEPEDDAPPDNPLVYDRNNPNPMMGRGGRFQRNYGGEFGGEFSSPMRRSPSRGPMMNYGGFESEMGGGYSRGAGMGDVPTVPHMLFRFVDLTTDVGKRYRYRVKLVVDNPNYMIGPAYLKRPDSGQEEFSYSDWSEPTEVVQIPQRVQILPTEVASSRGEPEAAINLLGLLYWEKPEEKKTTKRSSTDSARAGGLGEFSSMSNLERTETWIEVMKDFRLPLGGVAYFKDETVEDVVDMSTEQVKKFEKLTFNANGSMLLDLRNDDPLGASRSKGPTEMLFFDRDGRLIASTSAMGKLLADDYKNRTEVPEDDTGYGGFRGEFGPGPMRGPPGRGFGRGFEGP